MIIPLCDCAHQFAWQKSAIDFISCYGLSVYSIVTVLDADKKILHEHNIIQICLSTKRFRCWIRNTIYRDGGCFWVRCAVAEWTCLTEHHCGQPWRSSQMVFCQCLVFSTVSMFSNIYVHSYLFIAIFLHAHLPAHKIMNES